MDGDNHYRRESETFALHGDRFVLRVIDRAQRLQRVHFVRRASGARITFCGADVELSAPLGEEILLPTTHPSGTGFL